MKGVYDNGAAPAALVIDGTTAADLPTMRLSGNFGVSDVTSITVGSTNRALSSSMAGDRSTSERTSSQLAPAFCRAGA